LNIPAPDIEEEDSMEDIVKLERKIKTDFQKL
jgi:hypothetical protein